MNNKKRNPHPQGFTRGEAIIFLKKRYGKHWKNVVVRAFYPELFVI